MAGQGFFRRLLAGRLRREPVRDTDTYPRLVQMMNGTRPQHMPLAKPTPTNLRYFSRTPYARRAINAVKNPIAMLEWDVVPMDGVERSAEIDRQIEVTKACLARPNHDDSFRSLLEQGIEDILVCGAAAIEQQVGNDAFRPLWLWPVDALSIQIYPLWSGKANEARYMQTYGYQTTVGGKGLRNDELIYIRKDPATATPFSYGPIEVAFNTISRLLGVSDYAGNVASNAQPANILWFKGIDDRTLSAIRAFWRNDVEGQGQTPMFGGEEMKVLPLHAGGDAALYLAYQDMVRREIAAAFDISPQNLGLESDVNRSTSETAAERDWDGAIKPLAKLYASYLNREAIHGRLGFSQIRFEFEGLDLEDEKANAETYEIEYRNNAVTPNEYRERRGAKPLESDWGDKTFADMQIEMAGAKQPREGEPAKTKPKTQPRRGRTLGAK